MNSLRRVQQVKSECLGRQCGTRWFEHIQRSLPSLLQASFVISEPKTFPTSSNRQMVKLSPEMLNLSKARRNSVCELRTRGYLSRISASAANSGHLPGWPSVILQDCTELAMFVVIFGKVRIAGPPARGYPSAWGGGKRTFAQHLRAGGGALKGK